MKRKKKKKKLSSQEEDRRMKEIINTWKAYYREIFREFVYRLIRETIATKKLYYRDGGKGSDFRPVNSDYLYLFEKQAWNIPGGGKLYVLSGNGNEYFLLRTSIYHKALVEVDRELMALGIIKKNNKVPCRNRILNSYFNNDYGVQKPDIPEMINLILKNPNCRNLAFVKRKKQILEKIPEDITELYPEAREIERHFILHVGDTNTGKTYDAMKELASAKTGGYFAPLRLLALEGQEKLSAEGVVCSMRTGEEEDIRPDATHISCTVEMLDTKKFMDMAVIDEAQMIEDSSRGYAWTNAILGCYSPRIHVCMSENALNLIVQIIRSCGDTYEVIRHERNTELVFEDCHFNFPEDVRSGDAVILFSRRDVLAAAAELEKLNFRPSVIYGALPYNARKEEMRRFHEKETDVVVATDAIGMGINMPIRRIVFLRSSKYDGTARRPLTVPEIKQIAGRAGRMGIFNEGYVNAAVDRGFLKHGLETPYTDIENAGIQIPETLFSLPMKLSKIMEEWASISDTGFYRKVANAYRIKMCKWMEENHPDFSKDAMWTFLSIAYDEKNTDLQELWKKNVGHIAKGERIDADFRFSDVSVLGLEECESYYKKLDLYFSFARMLGKEYEEFRRHLTEEKEKISLKISTELKESKKENIKKCRKCGKDMSIIYPYNICSECHESMYIPWDYI